MAAVATYDYSGDSVGSQWYCAQQQNDKIFCCRGRFFYYYFSSFLILFSFVRTTLFFHFGGRLISMSPVLRCHRRSKFTGPFFSTAVCNEMETGKMRIHRAGLSICARETRTRTHVYVQHEDWDCHWRRIRTFSTKEADLFSWISIFSYFDMSATIPIRLSRCDSDGKIVSGHWVVVRKSFDANDVEALAPTERFRVAFFENCSTRRERKLENERGRAIERRRRRKEEKNKAFC